MEMVSQFVIGVIKRTKNDYKEIEQRFIASQLKELLMKWMEMQQGKALEAEVMIWSQGHERAFRKFGGFLDVIERTPPAAGRFTFLCLLGFFNERWTYNEQDKHPSLCSDRSQDFLVARPGCWDH